ncbi:hypothetical protein M440DRAFT_17672 [Trichoderma longibrachiatum ATCC 18648]|uniref:Uncharacterized protein n=1 Tax=Trichoderma longibrachiatum ATCC 18648 TaxID=983965 RepID=A0A2T4C904_TRILO|nr:hypothetical protein M440DRAFT_17672 [Trichoderma longibrachiatum ATCC 18648]
MVSAIATPPIGGSPYRLANLANLQIGYSVVPSWLNQGAAVPMANVSPPSSSSHKQGGARSSVSVTLTEALQTPPGVYTVQQLVANSGPLLDVVISRLGQDPPGQPSASSILIDGLAASLSTRGRESTFPLENASNDAARSEIVHQANRVASTIVKHVKKTVKPAPKSLDFRIRSPCEGHLWTHSVAALLFGPRSDSQLMELYNEWLHRMVLLRDSLIPFENFEEVPLASDSTAYVHSAASILSKPGLVISPRVTPGSPPAVHVIPTADPILRLALLGKLYPENVVLVKEHDSLGALGRVGKNFAEKIVIFEKNAAAASA